VPIFEISRREHNASEATCKGEVKEGRGARTEQSLELDESKAREKAMTDAVMAHGDDFPWTAIPPVSLVLNETISLVASMRKQSRWSTSSVAAILGGAIEANIDQDGDLATRWGLRGNRSAVSENPLLAGFSKLRQDLLKVEGMSFRRGGIFSNGRYQSIRHTGVIATLPCSHSKFSRNELGHISSTQLSRQVLQLSHHQ
jgi:hypothetical protein